MIRSRVSLLFIAFAFLLTGSLFEGCTSRSVVVEAAEEGDLRKVQALIAHGGSINERSGTKFGWTPLIAAVYHNRTDVIHYLVESGADLNLGDKSGMTPLMWAIGRGDDGIDLVKYLIAHGADLSVTDKDGATAITFAESDPPKPKILEALKAANKSKGEK
jgi:ankyrin repeat protein